MFFQREAFGLGHSHLALFNLGIVKLFDASAIEAHQMIMMRAFVELIHRLAALEIAACQQASLLKLREHAIDGGQADVCTLIEQHAIDIFRSHVALISCLKNLHDFQAGQSGFEPSVFQFIKRGHGAVGCGEASRYNGLIITLLLLARTCLASSSLAMPVFTACSFALRCAVLGAVCVGLSACSSFNSASGRIAGLVSPYKVEVVQGNFVSKEQKEALQVGMPRAQVKDILGSPLVSSAFHADRWEYVFTIRRQGQEAQQRKLTVFFKGDELAKVESDEMIPEEDFVTSLSVGRKLGKVPLLEVPADKLPAAAATPPATSTNATSAGEPPRTYPPLETVGR
jgi:outer membrane protein assembly factor BamE